MEVPGKGGKGRLRKTVGDNECGHEKEESNKELAEDRSCWIAAVISHSG